MDLDMGVAVIRIVAGLVLMAHGAQKAFGWSGGPGMERWTGAVESMGFRPARWWAYAPAYGELVGGLLMAVGLLTGLAAGILVVDMVVAIWKAHWPKGFWISKGGYEHALLLLVIFGVFGLMGAGLYSLDAPLRLASWTTTLFLITLVLGLTSMWAATRPAEIVRVEEERRRHAA